MKCRSVACIWSGAPLYHRITSAAVLATPPTLYTGGSDGSIVWWNLFGTDSDPVIVWPSELTRLRTYNNRGLLPLVKYSRFRLIGEKM